MIIFAAFVVLAASCTALSLPSSPDMDPNLSSPNAALLSSTSSTNVTTVQSLNIITENCGYDHGNINDLFRESRSLLLKPLIDAILGTDSKHGFKSMFKSNLAKSTVEAILGGIYYGKVKAGLKPGTDTPKGPRLSCVSPDSAQIHRKLDLGYDPWDRCLGSALGGTPIPAFYADGTVYLFLCPAFFALDKDVSKAQCPTVHNNEFEGDPDLFYRKFQTYTLIYHLLRFYLGENALNSYSDPREKLDWNDCVRLGSQTVLDTVRNPTSLQLYIALVSQDCRQIPNPPSYIQELSTATKLTSLPSESASYDPWLLSTPSPRLAST